MPEILRIFGLRFFFSPANTNRYTSMWKVQTARQNLISFPTALCWSIIKA